MEAYRTQNQFLNSEIHQVTKIWRKVAEKERALLMKVSSRRFIPATLPLPSPSHPCLSLSSLPVCSALDSILHELFSKFQGPVLYLLFAASAASDHRNAEEEEGSHCCCSSFHFCKPLPCPAEVTARQFEDLAPFSLPFIFLFFPLWEPDIKD